MANKYSPLERGDWFELSQTAIKKANALFPAAHQFRLRIGHAVQFTHDEIFEAAGWECFPSSGPALYDRVFQGQLQDDKVATFFDKHGKIKDAVSEYHTISSSEILRWNREFKENDKDVVIHSFEFIGPSHTLVRYMGPLSYLAARGFLSAPKPDTGTCSLKREPAYKHNLL